MALRHFDLVVIGGGSGGVRAARLAARRGARVALAEGARLGGTCVNLGCIPKKLYSHAAHHGTAFEEARAFGWRFETPVLDWAELKRRRAAEVARLNQVYAGLLSDAGVTVLPGWARLTEARTVQVGEQTVTAERVLLATGGAPGLPGIEGAELGITSNQLFDLEPFPRRLVVVGGGYIGCEFASIFTGLGAQVSLLHRGERLLEGFDDEVRDFVAGELVKKGVELRLAARVEALAPGPEGVSVRLGGVSALAADAVLLATGRAPCTGGLGLEALGLQLDERGAVPVDRSFTTALPWLHAIGDVTGRQALTPVALMQAAALIDRLYGCGDRPPREMSEDLVPTAVFCDPPVAAVGLTEAEARRRHAKVRIWRSEFRPLRHAVSGSPERALMKLVVDGETDRVLGVHLVAPEAPEVVQGFAVAIKAGVTKALLDSTVAVHPSLAEELVLMRDEVCRGGSSLA
ncbi:glutathione-disulfide reductase [Aquabacterium sp. A7-Y]|uniref:glutathione-disulfide reductase n=1 Tax=Aquabacterium sp. A7-Y TaxID=1349605 RepID=UPI00223CDBCD|nr:glutathione-disulfide reductase [Aquabacterium sp. A7-Y]MCW7539397.1 glutathione-disulfide reductase [Aquabacterium sp. A7-Y]